MGIDIKLKMELKGIDIDKILDQQEKELKKAVKSLAMTTYSDIVSMAQNNLYSSRLDYIKSLDFQSAGDIYVITIREPGEFFEDGFPSFDQKPGLLNGPKSKISKEGNRYNIVPYLHRPKSKDVPEKRSAYHEELQKTVARMEKIVPREIYDRSGRVVGTVVARAPKDIEGYTAGMIKIRKQYDKGKQSTYLTFRGVSEKSNPADWIHPGFEGLHAFDAAEKMLDDRIDQIISVIFGV